MSLSLVCGFRTPVLQDEALVCTVPSSLSRNEGPLQKGQATPVVSVLGSTCWSHCAQYCLWSCCRSCCSLGSLSPLSEEQLCFQILHPRGHGHGTALWAGSLVLKHILGLWDMHALRELLEMALTLLFCTLTLKLNTIHNLLPHLQRCAHRPVASLSPALAT